MKKYYADKVVGHPNHHIWWDAYITLFGVWKRALRLIKIAHMCGDIYLDVFFHLKGSTIWIWKFTRQNRERTNKTNWKRIEAVYRWYNRSVYIWGNGEETARGEHGFPFFTGIISSPAVEICGHGRWWFGLAILCQCVSSKPSWHYWLVRRDPDPYCGLRIIPM